MIGEKVENEDNHEEEQKEKESEMDNYEIERELDKGSYGTVFLAIDKRTQQKVAVKIVDKKKIRELGKERHIMREKNLL